MEPNCVDEPLKLLMIALGGLRAAMTDPAQYDGEDRAVCTGCLWAEEACLTVVGAPWLVHSPVGIVARVYSLRFRSGG